MVEKKEKEPKSGRDGESSLPSSPFTPLHSPSARPSSPFTLPSSRPVSVAVYALTTAGAELALKIAEHLPESSVFLPGRLVDSDVKATGFPNLSSAIADNFSRFGGHVVIAAAGIVVRTIAPLLKDKTRDPAVVTVDQEGRFAVSLLSGHLGGANELARIVADILGGRAVITTATDTAQKPSLDLLAVEAGLKIENTGVLPRISRAVLENEPVDVYDPEGRLKPYLTPWPDVFGFPAVRPDPDHNRLVVWVGNQDRNPARSWLLLRPPNLVAGIGCNRGTQADEMEVLIRSVFDRCDLSLLSLGRLASVEAKRDESGLLELADRLGVEISFFSTDELKKIDTPNPSTVVQKHMGVKSVCEAAAMLAAQTNQLLVTKRKSANATMAVAQTCFKSSA